MAAKAKRSFGLSAEDVQELSAEFAKTKRLPSPYRAGAFGFTVQALVTLGAKKRHALAKVQAAFQKAAGTDWYTKWANQEKRNKETGLDADGRFLQNLRVLQRTADYGLKLLEVGQKVMRTKGAVIDLSRDSKGAIFVALNTDSDTPIKPGRPIAEAQTAPEPSQTAVKATGGKRKAKAAKKPKTLQKAARTPRKGAKAD